MALEIAQHDVEYARPEGQPLLARIYRPRTAGPEPWPLLVDVHGGAWTDFMPERLIESHEMFFGDEATMGRASALRIVEAGEAECLPPIWVAHPELDENVTLAMSERFVAAYRRAGGVAELELFPGVGHGFANFPGEAADRCIARMRRFIRGQVER